MIPDRKFSVAMVRCLLVSVTMTFLGVTWGCGDSIPPQAPADSEQVKDTQDHMKEFMSKKGGSRKK